ncbi:PAS domain S-box protein [Sutcliffiella horikoshii]|uniref:PAS domain S-box protein n=1 Tax=Sutcliffiella horikoshii TaxID=79883 RepID=A0AA94WQ91_9BACI|nr:PAS domain S-box protein [Sutcliffiella horikoshii]TYS57499.1 PAS domain S-box protein [Sutcliffiella horikoshii]
MSDNIEDFNYKEVMDYCLDPLIVHSQQKILFINKAAEKFLQGSKEEVIGSSPLDIFKDSSKPAITNIILEAYSKPAAVIEETVFRMGGSSVEVELYCHPIKLGKTKAIQTYVKDITERKQQEKILFEMNIQINELASKIVHFLDGIAILPLSGAINQERAIKLLELVPVNVQEQEVTHLIIDCSGIYEMDSLVIDSLFRITNVLNLLGVTCILTGVRPLLAVEAVKHGISVKDIITYSSVKDALSFLGVNCT